MKGRRRTTIFRPGLMSNLIIYYKLINYKCMDNIMKVSILFSALTHIIHNPTFAP
ncbi:hypothetical protein BSFG_04935 [Bacteroides sp. 4_3_47FAA]|nr:hypothetical protein BSFG_04935 [Bacteroides sp. 4_3_47FAA]